jgi:hypothetical protein
MKKILILIFSASLFGCAGMWEGMGAASNDKVLLLEEKITQLEEDLAEAQATISGK